MRLKVFLNDRNISKSIRKKEENAWGLRYPKMILIQLFHTESITSLNLNSDELANHLNHAKTQLCETFCNANGTN